MMVFLTPLSIICWSSACYRQSREDVDTLLLTAVSALQLFVQHNWTGPITLIPQQIADDVLNIDIQVSVEKSIIHVKERVKVTWHTFIDFLHCLTVLVTTVLCDVAIPLLLRSKLPVRTFYLLKFNNNILCPIIYL